MICIAVLPEEGHAAQSLPGYSFSRSFWCEHSRRLQWRCSVSLADRGHLFYLDRLYALDTSPVVLGTFLADPRALLAIEKAQDVV